MKIHIHAVRRNNISCPPLTGKKTLGQRARAFREETFTKRAEEHKKRVVLTRGGNVDR